MWCRGGVVLCALLMRAAAAAAAAAAVTETTAAAATATNHRDGTTADQRRSPAAGGFEGTDADADVPRRGGDMDASGDETPRDQRCSVPVVTDDGDPLLEAARTVDRYRLRPAVRAYYDGPVVYRERPAAAVAYVRRRVPPVAVVDRPLHMVLLQSRPEDAATARYHYEVPAADGGGDAATGPPWLGRTGKPPYASAPGGNRRPIGEPLVSLTADQVRRVLQRVYSEGVLAGEATAGAGPKFIKVRSSEQMR